MAKRIFIIHGWTGNPNEHWMPWLDTKLKENGFEVFQPEMPETDHPKMDAWISTLKKEIGAADSNTYLVGHSIGCLAILRYLEKYGEKIGGAVLVAPWTSLYPESFSVPEDQEVVDEWTKGGFDWNKLKELCPHYVALLSKDDPDVPYDENKPVFEKELSAKIITFEDKGHFTSDDGATELPQALDEVLKMSQ